MTARNSRQFFVQALTIIDISFGVLYWNKLLQPVPAKRNKMAWTEDVAAMSSFLTGDIIRAAIAVATRPVDWRMRLVESIVLDASD